MKPPFIKEYRDLKPEDESEVKILAKGIAAFNREYTLKHHTAGYEPAGSCARYAEEKFSVTYPFDNAIHGKAFKTEIEAKEYFDKHTQPIIEARSRP